MEEGKKRDGENESCYVDGLKWFFSTLHNIFLETPHKNNAKQSRFKPHGISLRISQKIKQKLQQDRISLSPKIGKVKTNIRVFVYLLSKHFKFLVKF